MKRFFKTGAACVLALALMSTSAFAAVTGGEAKFVDGKLNVTIEGTETSEQVALMVLKGEHKTTDILASVQNTDIAYIDQKAGGASLAFSGINVGTENVVTVFAGSTNTAKAVLLGRATLAPHELHANKSLFNAVAGVETLVDLALTDENGDTVSTDVNVTYRVKDSGAEYADASTFVSYDGSWKFNFNTAKTYEVMFKHNGVSIADPVVVCVYDKIDPTPIGGNSFVKVEDPKTKKVVAAVKVNFGEQSADGKLIWSITANGTHYFTKAQAWDASGLTGDAAINCGFVNTTDGEVTAVNIIYKNLTTGKVFFTDPTDAGREIKKF